MFVRIKEGEVDRFGRVFSNALYFAARGLLMLTSEVKVQIMLQFRYDLLTPAR